MFSRYLVSIEERAVVSRVGDDIALSGRVFIRRQGGVTQSIQADAENTERLDSSDEHLGVRHSVLHPPASSSMMRHLRHGISQLTALISSVSKVSK